MIVHTRYRLTPVDLEARNSAVAHRLTELTMNKLYECVQGFSLEICHLNLESALRWLRCYLCTGRSGTLSSITATKNSKSKGNGVQRGRRSGITGLYLLKGTRICRG
ncbi:Hha/YmoA family nucleoid-associated regulatory protein [Escherichia coli]|uniref:Hha/YmoA family nucleoid-associated regulatory protein n=1 Tax=Escherichia coli TaxID=562 RepID=UPI003D805EBC